MLEIILVILALVAIAGVGIYFYIDMKDHKATNSTDFEQVNKNLDSEKTTRLGNIKYVVDQVNTVNEEMDEDYIARFTALEAVDTGFGQLIKTGPDTAPTDIKDTTNPQHINLMKHVSMIGGMSIKDLQSVSNGTLPVKTFKACGTGTGAAQKCIEFPNSDGDTYLTALNGATNSVVSGSPFEARSGAKIIGDLKVDSITRAGTASDLTIQTSLNKKITVSEGDGITVLSGGKQIKVTDTGVEIITNSTGMDGDVSGIKINGKTLGSVGIGSSATIESISTSLGTNKILTIAA